MSCGPGAGLKGLTGALDSAKGAINGAVADAEAGIAGAIEGLESALDGAVGPIVGKIKGLMPDIKLPELDIPDLESLLPKLPELPELPDLQKEMGALLDFGKDPLKLLQLDKNLASIKDKFPGVDIDKLKGDLISGDLNAETLCKLVPNIKGDIKLGIPSKAPEADAEAAPAAFSPIEIKLPENPLKDLEDKIKKELEAKQATITAETQNQLNNLGL